MKLTTEALLEAIRLTLDGNEWDSDTCQDIADLMTAQGYQIRDVDEAEADSPYEAYEYSVCQDCLFYIAYGDIPSEWEGSPALYLRGIAEDIEREVGERKGHFSTGVQQTVEDPDGGGYEEFSWDSCELCRDTKGGSRHGVTLLIEKPTTEESA